ncbi:TPA: O-antigen ligase family protein, partial [Klebsiella pneumoniae]|nr:O-antigen ligase family protein [Klebsiella pneumoniae]
AFCGFSYFIYGTDFFEKRLAFVASGTVDGSTQYRLDLWQRAWDLVLNYPLFGVGMGQESWMLKVDNLESSIMQILVNFGFFGLALFLLSITFVFIKSLRNYSLLG